MHAALLIASLLGITEVTGFGTNPGQLKLFITAPANLPASGVPLVVALHGCTQSAADYDNAGWDALADEHHFMVAYVQKNFGACFDWYSSAQQRRTGAEVTSILQMVEHLKRTRGVSPSRIFVTGLSAGGAMATVLLAVAPDVFTRGAVLAGVPFGCATNQTEGAFCAYNPGEKTPAQWGAFVRAVSNGLAAPRVQLWHGTSDGTVAFSNLAAEISQWTDVNAIDATADETTMSGQMTRRAFRDAAGVTRVEAISIAGMNHGTPVDPPGCGIAGGYMLDVNVCSSRIAADFFGLTTALPIDADAGIDAGPVDPDDAGVMLQDAGMISIDAGSDLVPDAGAPIDGPVSPQGCGCTSVTPFAALLLLSLLRRRLHGAA